MLNERCALAGKRPFAHGGCKVIEKKYGVRFFYT